MPKRVIAHLDCDAFYATVELLRRPDLRGQPVIVSGSGPRAVVTTASYEARRFGVGSAMATAHARRLCPQAVIIPPDFPAYSEKSREVWALVGERLAVVQQLGLDEAYADLTGVDKPLRVLRELIAELRERTGITISAGVAPNRLIAKIASDLEKPAGFVALGREAACERLAGCSPRIVPGIGPKSVERLASLGYATIADLQRATPETLKETFGDRQGAFLHARAFFHDDSPVQTMRVTKSRSNETTFDTDVADHDELERVLVRLADDLAAGMERREKRGRTIGIKVRLDDWTTITRARTIDRYVNDAATIRGIAVELLRAYAPPRPVRLIGVRVAGFEDAEAAEAAEAAGAAQAQETDQLALPL